MVQIKSHVLVKGSWLPLFWWFLFRQNMASVSIDIDTEMNVWIKNDQKTLHVLLFCICISSVWCVDVHVSSFRAHFWQIRWRSGTNWCLHVSLSLSLSLSHTPWCINKAVQNMLINHWFIYSIPKFTLANSWRLQRIRQFLLFLALQKEEEEKELFG